MGLLRPEGRISPPATLAVLAAAYAVFWLDLFLPSPAVAGTVQGWLAFGTAKNLLRIIGLSFLMARWRGFAWHGIDSLSLRSWTKLLGDAFLAALWLAAGALAGILFALAAGLENPLLPRLEGLEVGFLPVTVMVAASFSTGYAEEMFFRFFAPSGLAEAGVPALEAGIAASAVFGISHGSQGFFGMAMAFALGLILWSLRRRGKGLHALAIGHGIYNLCVMLLAAGR